MPDRTIASGRITESSETSLTIKISDNYIEATITPETELETNLDIGNHITAYLNLGKDILVTKVVTYDPNRKLV